MSLEYVYRIKDKNSELYWDGIKFGSIGKIYVNPKLAVKATANKRMTSYLEDTLECIDLVVVETSIEDTAEYSA